MFWLISLLVLETAFEGFLCSGLYSFAQKSMQALSIICSLLLLGTFIIICTIDSNIWIWGAPFVAYRLLNIHRLQRGRLPPLQLQTVSLRAYGWLVGAQAVVTIIALLTVRYHLASVVLDVLLVGQLLAALILLRASTNTWQFSRTVAGESPITDRQLPTVSVLVPARNETDDLDICLRALTSSDYPKLEILVLDDCSANLKTPAVIRSFAHAGVRFIQGEVPDEHRWLAKNFAYAQLARQASGEILLFCGVDMLSEPHSIRMVTNQMQTKKLDMISIMPLRSPGNRRGIDMLQTMRYYWEMCLPRGLFKRPPVLSTCWMIRRQALERSGGFESVSRSISPEASFARRMVVNDTYRFLRSDDELGISSNKSADEQYATSVRVRYPQLHRRLELVALVSVFEAAFLLGPFVGLLLASHLKHSLAYVAVWLVSLLSLVFTYGLVGIGTRLSNPWYGWLFMPVAFVIDLAILHISLWKYEFTSVDWKGRNVCIPVMQLGHSEQLTRQDSARIS